jgi:hypothetical protein
VHGASRPRSMVADTVTSDACGYAGAIHALLSAAALT